MSGHKRFIDVFKKQTLTESSNYVAGSLSEHHRATRDTVIRLAKKAGGRILKKQLPQYITFIIPIKTSDDFMDSVEKLEHVTHLESEEPSDDDDVFPVTVFFKKI